MTSTAYSTVRPGATPYEASALPWREKTLGTNDYGCQVASREKNASSVPFRASGGYRWIALREKKLVTREHLVPAMQAVPQRQS